MTSECSIAYISCLEVSPGGDGGNILLPFVSAGRGLLGSGRLL
jgi:hypothetical protein